MIKLIGHTSWCSKQVTWGLIVLFLAICRTSSLVLRSNLALAEVRLQETSSPPPIEDSLEHLKQGVTRFELSNGLRVVFFRRTQAPVFAGQTWVKVGGVNEVPGKTGIAHMLEHMAFKGSQKIGTRDYQKEKLLLAELEVLMHNSVHTAQTDQRIKEIQTELRALWLDNEFSKIYKEQGGVGLNAGTSKDYTMYLLDLPSVAFELWCWMESDRLLFPVFRQFYQEREVVLEERRLGTEDDPEGKLYEALLSTAYWSHPNRQPVIGWSSDVKHLTATDIDGFYHTYYRPDNMVMSVVGDLDLELVKSLMEKYFGRLPVVHSPLPVVTIVEEPQQGERHTVVEFDAEPSMIMAYHKPTYPHSDDAAFTVLHSILSGGRSSLLYKELVQKKQLASSIDTSEAPGELFPPLFYVAATPRRGVAVEVLRDQVQKIFDRLKEKAVAEKELSAAKRRVRVSLIGNLDSNKSLASTLGRAELLWNDWQAFFKIYDQVLATTPQDIKHVANTYLRVNNRTVAKLQKPGHSSR